MYKYFVSAILVFVSIASVFTALESQEFSAQSSEVSSWKLELYYRVDCPYCQKVIRYLNRSGIAIELKDIQRDDQFRQEVLGLTGTTRVPCLLINGEPLLESNDIIEWLDVNIASPSLLVEQA